MMKYKSKDKVRQTKPIFLIRGTNIYSTHWECVVACEDEEEANRGGGN